MTRPDASRSQKRPSTTAARDAAADDWRVRTLARVRALIERAAPGVVEERKWKKPSNPEGVAVWSLGGIICTGEIYRDKVKLTFMKGASLPAEHQALFNASLDGNARRALDIREHDVLDEGAFIAMVRAAVALNTQKRSRARKSARASDA